MILVDRMATQLPDRIAQDATSIVRLQRFARNIAPELGNKFRSVTAAAQFERS